MLPRQSETAMPVKGTRLKMISPSSHPKLFDKNMRVDGNGNETEDEEHDLNDHYLLSVRFGIDVIGLPCCDNTSRRMQTSCHGGVC